MPPLDVYNAPNPVVDVVGVEQHPLSEMSALMAYITSVNIEQEQGSEAALAFLRAWHRAVKQSEG